MAEPLFSVVIPVHDKAPHLPRCLDSVFAQTDGDFEILAIDDASTDGSSEILAQVADPRFRLFHRDRPGPGGYAARNHGIAQARGTWIAFLDADDSWQPGHLAQLRALLDGDDGTIALASTGHVIRTTDGDVEDRVTRRLPSDRRGPIDLDFPAFLRLWLDIAECPVWTSAIAVRRSLASQGGGFPERRCRRGGDKDTWLRLAAAGRVVIAPQPTATYHMDSVNMVTRAAPLSLPHCLEASALALAETAQARSNGDPAAAEAARLLRRLVARERFNYVLETARRGITPSLTTLRGAGAPDAASALRLLAILLRNRLRPGRGRQAAA